MFRMMKKGQAAMEFLMTYGWAILVVLAAIAALAYFGVLSPDQFLPERCTLPSGIGCLDFTGNSNEIQLRIQNSLGYNIVVTSFTLDAPEVTFDTCTNGTTGVTTWTMNNGDAATVICEVADPATEIPSGKLTADVLIEYTNMMSQLDHSRSGSVLLKIE